MAVESPAVLADAAGSPAPRWGQLACGIVCMVMIANLQYGWTLFVNPIDQKHHWGTAAIQVAFSVFIATETWLVPIEGWFVDRFGPRLVVAFGGILVAVAWTMDSFATSLAQLYIASAISGVGAGAVYGTCVGNALKWFPDRRGLAAGLTAAGFGAGTAATVIPIRDMILGYGYESAFLWFGLGQGLVVLLLSRLLRAPEPGETPKPAVRLTQALRDTTPLEMLRSPIFWLLYLMFVMVSASGLMATAQIAPIARDFHLANHEVTILFVTASTLSAALVIDNVLNGLARPFFGWISDVIGRENTMAIVFTLGAVAYWGLGELGHTPYMFILMAGLIFFTWGEIFSLFPSTCTDTYGSKYATTNAGLLYTAKGTSAWVVPLASLLKDYSGHWHWVFTIATVMNLIVAALALFVLKPMRRRVTRQG
ncbi:MAG: oxalate/formate MFS antiporter [Xanthobacteraceae bacterium]|nr:oxalate/formate MFS antiporter [Xanthobacteraceae bacterium]